MKKKVVAVLLSLMVTSVLFGCGDNAKEEDTVIGEEVVNENAEELAENSVSEEEISGTDEENAEENAEENYKIRSLNRIENVKQFIPNIYNEALYQDENGDWYWYDLSSNESVKITNINISGAAYLNKEREYAYMDADTGLCGTMTCSNEGATVVIEPQYNNIWLGSRHAFGEFAGLVSGEKLDIYSTVFPGGKLELNINGVTIEKIDFQGEEMTHCLHAVIYAKGDDGKYYTYVAYGNDGKENKVTYHINDNNYERYGDELYTVTGVWNDGDGDTVLCYSDDMNTLKKALIKDDIYIVPNNCASSNNWISCSRKISTGNGSYDSINAEETGLTNACFYNLFTGKVANGLKGSSYCKYRQWNGNSYSITKDDQIVYECVEKDDETDIIYPYNIINETVLNDDGFLYIDDGKMYDNREIARNHRLVQLTNEKWAYVDSNYTVLKEYDNASSFSTDYNYKYQWACVCEGDEYYFIDDEYNVISERYNLDGKSVTRIDDSSNFYWINNGDEYDVIAVAFKSW